MAVQFRRIIKMEHAARLEAIGVPDPDIALQLGLTYAGLATLKQDPDYDAVRKRILTGVVSHLDEELADDINYSRQRIREMVPVALDGLFESAIQTADKKLRLAACNDIMDRDGKLAKVSRIGVPTQEQGGVGNIVDDDVANALAQVLLTARHKQQAEQDKQSEDSNSPPQSSASTTIQ